VKKGDKGTKVVAEAEPPAAEEPPTAEPAEGEEEESKPRRLSIGQQMGATAGNLKAKVPSIPVPSIPKIRGRATSKSKETAEPEPEEPAE